MCHMMLHGMVLPIMLIVIKGAAIIQFPAVTLGD